MASARFRRAFQYPDDSGDDQYAREELDEEEQERVIQNLKRLNNRRNSEYSIIFTTVPIFSAAIYMPLVLSSSSTNPDRCLALTSMLSLLTTAFTMRYSPHSNGHSQTQQPLSLINAVLCVLLVLIHFAYLPRESWLSTELITSLMPGAMLATISVARRIMSSVDIKGLETLRYDYKGA
ncbi:uncharacterized protein BP01DRAFT_359995 [Aspergillus saccharolyticus JOP 1030-1]|uniref:Uncharacterized protein n=1 Tax=Aspergillus saccharolyticus JOP 1030-1 TaxID=1450539 RepID=A0A319A2Y0_9EURO|nr:hypothetical protein BP01DRAFT_359995 [Aspergillus saccharolyticus JOP 1030-1]PYH41802.1 hypothetical protein BP01DRAFT_359995 [Aspergillus saccharolyticus JOP 1030-1]